MRRAFVVLLVAVAACRQGPPPPAALDTNADTCRNCRMVVSDRHFAAQIVTRGEEPGFFDDLGCLRAHLDRNAFDAGQGAVYAADHRTGVWVRAESAVYTRLPDATMTPMGGGMVAHADEASRRADPIAAGGQIVPWTAIAGTGGDIR